MNKDEDDIEQVSETPTKTNYTPEELEEMVEQVKEEPPEEDTSDDTSDELPEMHHRLDAGDVVIIESEVQETEDTEEQDVSNTRQDTDSGGEDATPTTQTEEDTDASLEEDFSSLRYIAATEDLRSDFENIAMVGKTVFGIAGKILFYTGRILRLVRNMIGKLLLSTKTIANLYETKIRAHMWRLDEDKVRRFRATALPYEDWCAMISTALEIHAFLLKSETAVFEPGNINELTQEMIELTQKVNGLGITVDSVKNTRDLHRLFDKTKFVSPVDNGYTASELPNVMSYFKELADKLSSDNRGRVTNTLKVTWKKIEQKLKELKQAESRPNEVNVHQLALEYSTYLLRFNLMNNFYVLVYELYTKAVKDAQSVLSAYENALSLFL